jgi:3-dehydro-L-gulonate 2-dehydrogenase
MAGTIRVSYQEVYDLLLRILIKTGFEREQAELCSRLFTDSSRDGVSSHGLNRFPRFLQMIENGAIDIQARPVMVHSFGAVERWDGNRGPGNLNAYAAMARAISLSQQFGIGCVALSNTNHWMRGGSYGWQAADAGAIGICWTNTLPNLPPWGSSEGRVGNNPLVIAVPRNDGHVVLDMAMSQFSYGTLESYRLRNEQLPVVGGFDRNGELTRDAAAIEDSARPLPIGYWKGAGLALMLDMLAALLSGGNATFRIERDSLKETGLSQVFLAFDLANIEHEDERELMTSQIIDFLRGGPTSASGPVRYPGEHTLAVRNESIQHGIPVAETVWECLQAMDPEAIN